MCCNNSCGRYSPLRINCFIVALLPLFCIFVGMLTVIALCRVYRFCAPIYYKLNCLFVCAALAAPCASHLFDKISLNIK